MDITMILAFAGITAVILCALLFVLLKPRKPDARDEAEDQGLVVGQRRPVPRGAGAARARLRTGQQQPAVAANTTRGAPPPDRDDSEDEVEVKKVGAKKAAKLEAKAERKVQREAEERGREEKKKKKEQEEEERKKQEEKELLEEKKKEDEEKKALEEKERQEYDEYMKLKAAFTIEEEGCDMEEVDESDLLQKFIKYIQDMKVVALDELAAKFRIKTQAAIDRINELQKEERLSGVIDDRGKFIYISQEELEGIAKFIKQRGRVSLIELAENSNRLMNLTPQLPIDA